MYSQRVIHRITRSSCSVLVKLADSRELRSSSRLARVHWGIASGASERGEYRPFFCAEKISTSTKLNHPRRSRSKSQKKICSFMSSQEHMAKVFWKTRFNNPQRARQRACQLPRPTGLHPVFVRLSELFAKIFCEQKTSKNRGLLVGVISGLFGGY